MLRNCNTKRRQRTPTSHARLYIGPATSYICSFLWRGNKDRTPTTYTPSDAIGATTQHRRWRAHNSYEAWLFSDSLTSDSKEPLPPDTSVLSSTTPALSLPSIAPAAAASASAAGVAVASPPSMLGGTESMRSKVYRGTVDGGIGVVVGNRSWPTEAWEGGGQEKFVSQTRARAHNSKTEEWVQFEGPTGRQNIKGSSSSALNGRCLYRLRYLAPGWHHFELPVRLVARSVGPGRQIAGKEVQGKRRGTFSGSRARILATQANISPNRLVRLYLCDSADFASTPRSGLKLVELEEQVGLFGIVVAGLHLRVVRVRVQMRVGDKRKPRN